VFKPEIICVPQQFLMRLSQKARTAPFLFVEECADDGSIKVIIMMNDAIK
jgi:hypothetical protein